MGTVIFRDEKFDFNSTLNFYSSYWFNVDHYHKYQMSYLGSERFSIGPQKEQFTEVRLWMQDNLEGEILVSYDKGGGVGLTIYLYFQHETDLMAFKLMWGKKND